MVWMREKKLNDAARSSYVLNVNSFWLLICMVAHLIGHLSMRSVSVLVVIRVSNLEFGSLKKKSRIEGPTDGWTTLL